MLYKTNWKKEHKRAVEKGDAIAEHVWEKHHSMDWTGVDIFDLYILYCNVLIGCSFIIVFVPQINVLLYHLFCLEFVLNVHCFEHALALFTLLMMYRLFIYYFLFCFG